MTDQEDRPPWRPTMPRAEAEGWARHSVYRRPLFHATSRAAAEAIRRGGFDLQRRNFGRAWGIGSYATPDPDITQVYRSVISDGEPAVIELLANVRLVLSVDARPGETRVELRNRILGLIPGGPHRWFADTLGFRSRGEADAAALAFCRVLQEAGYDALEIREPVMSPAIGGTQLVVFSPRAVVVIDDA